MFWERSEERSSSSRIGPRTITGNLSLRHKVGRRTENRQSFLSFIRIVGTSIIKREDNVTPDSIYSYESIAGRRRSDFLDDESRECLNREFKLNRADVLSYALSKICIIINKEFWVIFDEVFRFISASIAFASESARVSKEREFFCSRCNNIYKHIYKHVYIYIQNMSIYVHIPYFFCKITVWYKK